MKKSAWVTFTRVKRVPRNFRGVAAEIDFDTHTESRGLTHLLNRSGADPAGISPSKSNWFSSSFCARNPVWCDCHPELPAQLESSANSRQKRGVKSREKKTIFIIFGYQRFGADETIGSIAFVSEISLTWRKQWGIAARHDLLRSLTRDFPRKCFKTDFASTANEFPSFL